MSKTTTFTVRATPQEIERWRASAGDMKFNSWVKSALNVAAGEETPGQARFVKAPPPRKAKGCSTPVGMYCYEHDVRHV